MPKPKRSLYRRTIRQSLAEKENLVRHRRPAAKVIIRGGLPDNICLGIKDYDGGLISKILYNLGRYFRNRPD